MGELSAAARALTAEPLAPGNEETLQELRDPARRPQVPRVPVPEAVLQHQPSEPVRLSWGAFVSNVRRARRGAAPGPSGCTNEHLRLFLETEEDMQLLHHAAQRLALGDVPDTIARALRLGRMVALRKPNGRVRGLVMGDTFRRLVAGRWRNSFPPPSTQLAGPSSSPSGLGPERRLLPEPSAPCVKGIRARRWSASTVSGRMTTSTGQVC